ncbi:hypothetical protein KCU62_g7088, partial [Aureobasidium sp. EXF-3399]
MQRREAGICFDFQKGKCNSGAHCRFSHDLTVRNTPKGPRGDDDAVSPELKKWKDQVFQRSSLGFGLGNFLGQASRLVQIDDSCRQEVIKSLATDRGLEKVLEIVNQDFARMSDKALMHTFDTRVVPFFCVLSDERVMSSPLLERHLGEICQYIYGVGGSRSELLFAAVVRALSTLSARSDLKFFTSLKATLAVLMKGVEFNSTAKVTPCFSTYATTLAAMLAPQSDPDADALRYQATKHLDSINKRLGIGAAIPNMDSVIQDKGMASRPVFSLTRSLPGRLANGRPRHNNDFDSIHDIQIMPTSEEIQSTHAEYLPSQDPSTWHMRGVEGLLDRHSRLLREDTIGQLRDSACVELEALQGMEPRHGESTLRKHTYRNVLVELPKFDSLRGLGFVISFDQPPELRSKSKKQRQDWWAHSKRLDGDALICLISSTQVFVFCSICFPHDPWKRSGKDKAKGPDPHQNIVSHADDRIRVIARPSEMNAESVANILGMSLEPKEFQGGRSLVEFPGVLLPAFMPTLTALKTIFKSGELPFSDFLAPSQGSGEETAVIPPPTYTQRAGFRFNLRSVVQSGDFSFDPSSLKQSDIKDLQEASTLDETQASALLNSLSRSFALIQGPPGTGKSYTGVALMKTLVSNKKAAKLGPILVVTFTNHALDQSLEHLLDQGIGQIVRIGGNSRSERLASVNLKIVAAKVERTRAENSEYGRTRSHMDEDTKAIVQCLDDLRQDTNNIKEYLAQRNRHHYVQLFGADRDEDGWQAVQHGKKGQRYKKWLRGGKHLKGSRALNMIVKTTSLYDLSNSERGLLHDYWLRMAQKPILSSLVDNVEDFTLGLDAIKNETDLRALSEANVIGVTTSGLARNLELLRKLPSKILLCEEAGEVLEAHLLTALLPSIEHAILIGDHLQLRPHVSCYGLSQESVRGQQYALDTSLFERLVTATAGGVRLPFSRLDTQRRMHPEIAELVRSTLYPELADAPSTLEHPQVAGLKKRLFWLDHQQPETHNDVHSTSHSNDYEVEMTTALVSHLIKQGVYKSGSIAVLTPYVGQLKKLQHRMQSAFEVVLDDRDIKVLEDAGLDDAAQSRAPPAPGVQKGSMASAVRLATVDNFQGEEAEVVVISLVRSNDRHSCGFLRTSNRINVLLSRAKNAAKSPAMMGLTVVSATSHAKSSASILDAVAHALSHALHVPTRSVLLAALTRCTDTLKYGHQRPSVCGAPCPEVRFCQECADEDTKSRVVDLIMMSQYSDIDLDEDPCIFPTCGHFYTITTMDGHLSLGDHYVLDANGMPTALKAPDGGLDVDKTRIICPDCRRSLREIPRYGRVVRRALLIQSTLKFITRSNKDYVMFYGLFIHAQKNLQQTLAEAVPTQANLHLAESRDKQIHVIRSGMSKRRYGAIVHLRNQIDNFKGLVGSKEQPFKRVQTLVRHARLNQRTAEDFTFDESVILQTRSYSLATSLLIRCDLTILSDVLAVRSSKDLPVGVTTTVDFVKNRVDCEALFKIAEEGKHYLQQAEALIFWAQFAALEVSWRLKDDAGSNVNATNALRSQAKQRLEQARIFCAEHSQARTAAHEIETVEKMLRESTFYSPVTNKEMEDVVNAMAREFRGTGHWYRCRNGHPFTVGECGGPMVESVCPQCDEPVGGRNHQAAEGVTIARDLETGFSNMRL